MEKESTNNTLLPTVFLGLCSYLSKIKAPTENWNCENKSNNYYKLKTLRGKILKLTTLQKLPLSGAIKDENGRLQGTGIAFDLIHEMQEKIGFFYNITLPAKNVIGNEKEGIIQMLKNKEVDIAVAFIPIMHALEQTVSYSSDLSDFEWVLLMARPSASASGTGLLAPFQHEVWICILISLIIAGPVMYLIVYLRIKIQNRKNSSIKPYSLNSCYWFVYGALMKQGSILNPKYDSPRVFFAAWWIFITILTSFYTANLTAFLTLSRFTLTIQTTKDIRDHHRHWFADEGGYEESLINIEDSFEYLKETIPDYGEFTSDPINVRLQQIMKGKIYVSERRAAEKIVMSDYLNKTKNFIEGKKRCTFVITEHSVLEKRMGFAYQRDSELRDLLDPLLRQFVTGGIINHLLEANLSRSNICPLDLSSGERKLLNSNLATTYTIMFIGFASAFVVFLGEVITSRFFKNKRKRKKIVLSNESAYNYKSHFKNINNLLSTKQKGSNSKFNDNFLIEEYFKEMMPYSYSNEKAFALKKNKAFNAPDIEPKNVIYQFIN